MTAAPQADFRLRSQPPIVRTIADQLFTVANIRSLPIRREMYLQGNRAFSESVGLEERVRKQRVKAAMLSVIENRMSEHSLTSRERQIALMMASGLTTKDVATELNLSLKTVESHKFNIYKKLGVHKNVELAQVMYAEGRKDVDLMRQTLPKLTVHLLEVERLTSILLGIVHNQGFTLGTGQDLAPEEIDHA